MNHDSQLARGEAPVYLLHGDEPFFTREAAAWLRTTVLAGAPEDFNLDRFDAKEDLDPERIAQAARTLPMMGPKRLVLVRQAEVLLHQPAAKVKPIVTYLKDPDPMSCLLFVANTKVRKNASLYKAVKKAGVVVEYKTPWERELTGWVQGRARNRGRQLRPDAAHMLVHAIGRDVAGLDAALDRLCLYVDGGAPIEAQHVEETVSHTRTRTVWELVDAIAERDTPQALARAHRLLEQGESALALLGMVARQFRQLMIGSDLRASGMSPTDAAKEAGVPAFRARAFARQLEKYRMDELVGAVARLAEADAALKGSKLSDALIFEGALLDLCSGT